jgi:inosine-uridine nucleoside N-ribohydrolase
MTLSVILDTDMDTDCDDAGALAMLHAFERQEKSRLLGVVCDVPVRDTARCVQTINGYYGKPEIPVGILTGVDLSDPRYAVYRQNAASEQAGAWTRYNHVLGQRAPRSLPVEEAVSLYRKILSEQPDQSVTILAIGLLSALQGLVESGQDGFSPLDGLSLIRKKVARLVTMGVGSFPSGSDVFNWKMDLEAAGVVLNHWPTDLVVSEWGEQVLTGAGLQTRTQPENPVRQAYEMYQGGPGRNRSSWDQLAVLYGVSGSAWDGQPFFEEVTGHRLVLNAATGEHHWSPDLDSRHIYLKPVVSEQLLARTVEDLMTYIP